MGELVSWIAAIADSFATRDLYLEKKMHGLSAVGTCHIILSFGMVLLTARSSDD